MKILKKSPTHNKNSPSCFPLTGCGVAEQTEKTPGSPSPSDLELQSFYLLNLMRIISLFTRRGRQKKNEALSTCHAVFFLLLLNSVLPYP